VTLLTLNADAIVAIADVLWSAAWRQTAIKEDVSLPLGPSSYSTAQELLDITSFACSCAELHECVGAFIRKQKHLAKYAWERMRGWSNPEPEAGFAACLYGFASAQLIHGARHPDTIALLDQLMRACLAQDRLNMYTDCVCKFNAAGGLDYVDLHRDALVRCEWPLRWQPANVKYRPVEETSRVLFKMALHDNWARATARQATMCEELGEGLLREAHEESARRCTEYRDELLGRLLGADHQGPLSRSGLQQLQRTSAFCEKALIAGRVGVAEALAAELCRRGRHSLGADHPLVLGLMRTQLHALLAQLRVADARPLAIELELRSRRRLRALYHEPHTVVHSRAATELSDEMDVDALSQLEAARDLFHITTTLITVLDEDVEADAQMLSVAEARVTFWMHAAGELADYDEVDIPTVLDDRLMALAARSVMDKVPTLRWAEERPPPPPQPPPL
jgi:hypothetical protein